MRTTLKRGIGRGATVNGNGRVVYPPGVLTPMTRYRTAAPSPRGRLWLLGRILVWLLATATMVGAGLVGGAYLYFHEKVSDVRAHTPAVKIAAKRLDVALPGKPAIALVVGYDKRLWSEDDEIPRSDTIMLLRADPETESVSMLSFPRDMVVEVHCPGRPTVVNRINAAYSECGPKGTLETVKQLTGLPINYLIVVNFRGFRDIVNRLGGVWIDVDRRYFNDNGGRTYGTYAAIDLQPGYQRLGGPDILDFVRFRHTDSDFHRNARQQLFVKAAKHQLTATLTAANVTVKLPALVDAVTDNVEIGVGGGKALEGKTVLSYALFAYQLPAGHIFQARIAGLEGYAELHTAPGNVQAAVSDFASPDLEAPEKATAVALGRKVRLKTGPRPADTTLTVLNGNGVSGSATNAAFELATRGYKVVTGELRNAPSFNYFRTKVYFDPQQRTARAAAGKMRNLFGDADVEPIPADIRPRSNGAMLTVVVGQTFHGTLAPTPVDKTPKPQPTTVYENPGATVPLLQQVRRRLPFTLMVPHKIDSRSTTDPQMPVRVYQIKKGHRALRLTFRTTGDLHEYWGIEQTDWEDAPILSSPNVRQRIGGRLYELHYDGAKLHMVVLREKGATYWVVNTLLDSLSNETMLAIAKSLRPLGK